MKIGTKSLLFGVHQFIWHPISVGLAWRKCYRTWPRWGEWIAIICHDLGYWGKPDMDGAAGQSHPELGAKIAGEIAYRVYRLLGIAPDKATHRADEVERLSLYHSTYYAQRVGKPVSKLYLPDKVSILFEPRWWYLLRSKASGEIYEYLKNAPPEANIDGMIIYKTPIQWFGWYKENIQFKLADFLDSLEKPDSFKYYYIRHTSGCYYGACHTNGSPTWVDKRYRAEIYGEGDSLNREIRILLKCGYDKEDLHLELCS